MAGDRERIGAFAFLFGLADVPLLALEALPATGWSPAAGVLVPLAWGSSGTYLVAASRATHLETRGWRDAPWVLATLAVPVGLIVLGAEVPGWPRSPWTTMAAIGATTLLGLFWAAYLRGGGIFVGPAPARVGLGPLAPEDRVVVLATAAVIPLAVATVALFPAAPDALLLAFIVGFPLASYWGAMWWFGRRRTRAWSRLADRLGWEEDEGPGEARPLDGTFRGREARVGAVRERMRWLTFWSTDSKVALEEAPDVTVRLTPEGRLGRLQRALGARDIEVGDERLDGRFLVDAPDRDLAGDLLRSVGDRILGARPHVRSVLVQHGDVTAVQHGFVADPERIREALDVADRVAQGIEDRVGGEDEGW